MYSPVCTVGALSSVYCWCTVPIIVYILNSGPSGLCSKQMLQLLYCFSFHSCMSPPMLTESLCVCVRVCLANFINLKSPNVILI